MNEKDVGELSSQELIDTLETYDFVPRSYSGRAMYGKCCIGVVGDPFEIGYYLGQEYAERYDAGYFSWRTDDLGRDTIMYFPQFEWPKDEDE